MKIWTIQLAQRKLAEMQYIPVLDTTVKSGRPAFAPSWFLVLGHKNGTVSDDEYTEEYWDMLETTFAGMRKEWTWLFAQQEIALACYCRAGKFCHRHILKQFIKEKCELMGLEFIDAGEIYPGRDLVAEARAKVGE